MYRLYAKGKDQKQFKPMDYNGGVQVTNLIYATVFSDDQYESLKKVTKELNEYHDEYVFEIRKVK